MEPSVCRRVPTFSLQKLWPLKEAVTSVSYHVNYLCWMIYDWLVDGVILHCYIYWCFLSAPSCLVCSDFSLNQRLHYWEISFPPIFPFYFKIVPSFNNNCINLTFYILFHIRGIINKRFFSTMHLTIICSSYVSNSLRFRLDKLHFLSI